MPSKLQPMAQLSLNSHLACGVRITEYSHFTHREIPSEEQRVHRKTLGRNLLHHVSSVKVGRRAGPIVDKKVVKFFAEKLLEAILMSHVAIQFAE